MATAAAPKQPVRKKPRGNPNYPKPTQQQLQHLARASVLNRKKTKRGRRRLTDLELAERRQIIMSMRLRGKSLREIGKELGIGYMTVKRDLDAVAALNRQRISEFERNGALASAAHTYDMLEKEAWEQVFRCANGTSNRAQFMNLVRVVNNDRIKMLMDVGLIDKATQKVEVKSETTHLLEGWTKDAKQMMAMALLAAQIEGAEKDALPGDNGEGREILELPAHAVEMSDPPDDAEELDDDGGNGA
jgi:hypothetical protein